MQSLIDLAIANANTAYANSGVTQRVRLVHTQEVNYTESGAQHGFAAPPESHRRISRQRSDAA